MKEFESMQEINKKALDFEKSGKALVKACHEIGKSWSGSSLTGHAKFYFKDFKEPDVYNRFSIEWGLINGVPDGWSEKSDEVVKGKIESLSNVSLDEIEKLAKELDDELEDIKKEIIINLTKAGCQDTEKIENFKIKSATDYFNDLFPTSFRTRDSESMTGHYIVPHIYFESIAQYVLNLPNEIKNFKFEVEKILSSQVDNKIEYNNQNYYIENSVILALSKISSKEYDLSKLIKMTKELNDNYSLGNYLSCGMLIRSILDHVPPIFKKKKFTEVVNNYGEKSFKDLIKPLEESSRKIADSYLHLPVRSRESLPTKIQIEFKANMDILLSEIIRILK